MKQGNVIVEQIDRDGNIYMDFDLSLTTKAEKIDALSMGFGLLPFDANGKCYVYCDGTEKYSIFTKNITYLGIPHPIYKKRIQISDDVKSFYDWSNANGFLPILLGIYYRNDVVLYTEFNIESYIHKKAHNSSAHVYSYDLRAAAVDGYYKKIDYFKNEITVFHPKNVKVVLEDIKRRYKKPLYSYSDDSKKYDYVRENGVSFGYPSINRNANSVFKDTVIPKITEFAFSLSKHWDGIECYSEMIDDDYRNKYQPEWPGFYLEYKFEKYIEAKMINDLVEFAQSKNDDGIDLDLYFKKIKCYGDLKAHSSTSKAVQGNDWDTVFDILTSGDDTTDPHIYYLILEHDTTKDKDCNFVVTEFWNRVQNKENLHSYSNKMKNSIDLNDFVVLDINRDNCQYLSMFRQGINSDGKPRNPKIMIEDKNFDKFMIKTIELR